MINNLTCLISGYVDIRNLSRPNFCADNNTAARSHYDLKNLCSELSKNPQSFGCPTPCNTSFFELVVGHTKVNSFIDPSNRYNIVGSQIYILGFSFTSLDIEEQSIILLYDIGMLLSSAGGNLGLALGFSCLSILLNLVEVLGRCQCFYKMFFFVTDALTQ
jgi:hypothetical protein